MIDIVIPVLNRPQNADRIVQSIVDATVNDYTITFIVSPHDDLEREAVDATGYDYIITNWEPGPGDGAKKWNLGYATTAEHGNPFVFLGADDLEFEYGWDQPAIEVATTSNAGVIGTDDDANPLVKRGLHSTHSLVSRSYIDELGGTFTDGPGVVYHEGYDHQYVDTELCFLAKQRGRWAFARGSIVRHLHPLFPQRGRERTQMDDTYRKAMAEGRSDAELYRSRLHEAGLTLGSRVRYR